MNRVRLPKLTPRGQKNLLHFRPCFEGKQLSWVNLGTPLKTEATKKAKRFVQLLELEGEEKARCDLKGESLPPPKSEKLPISDLIEYYKDFNESPVNLNPVKETSLQTYVYALKKVSSAAGAEFLEDLDGMNIIEVSKKYNPTVSNATIANNLRFVRAFVKPAMINYLKEKGYEISDPFHGQQIPRTVIEPYEPFSKEKQKELWDGVEGLPNAQAMIVKMALGIGLRRGEVEYAQMSWFTERDGEYFCKISAVEIDGVVKWTPKSNKERTVPIPKKLYKELFDLRLKCADYEDDTKWMVPAVTGGTPQSRLLADMTSVLKWLKEKGIQNKNDPKLMHVLRKQYGSRIAQDHGIHIASKYLGHASVVTTEKHYVGLLDHPVGDVMG